MKIEIGSVLLKGLPPEYARAVESGLRGELERAFSRGGRERRAVSADAVRAALEPGRWQKVRPEEFVREVAERIWRETMR